MERKVFYVIAVVVIVCAGSAFGRYSGGTGEPNNPYLIGTPADLNDIRNYPEDYNKCFLMINDINMAAYTYTTAVIAPDMNIYKPDFQGTKFTGTFDGNNYMLTFALF